MKGYDMRLIRRFICAAALLIGLAPVAGIAQTGPAPRFLETFTRHPDTVVVAIFHPTMYVIESVNALKKAGFIADNYYAVGLYHTSEGADYTESMEFADALKDKWIFFHSEDGQLSPGNIYTENDCADSYRLVIEKTDGAILFGGADIPPYCYNEETSLLTRISTPARHLFELSFVFNALGGYQDTAFTPLLDKHPEFPLLGICLGEQSINVGTGGTLIQDIWSELYGKKTAEQVILMDQDALHRNPWKAIYPVTDILSYSMHHITPVNDGLLHREFSVFKGQKPLVISSHHQAVENLGMNIQAAAYSADGRVVEAITHTEYPHVLGLQFHPEFSIIWTDKRPVSFFPGDEERTIEQRLADDNKSLSFHRRLWKWFFGKTRYFHKTSLAE